MLLKLFGIGPPQNEDNVFALLHSHLSNIKNLQKMKGFRNILIHQYGKIDQQRVLQFSRENISDFTIFLKDVKKILKNLKN